MVRFKLNCFPRIINSRNSQPNQNYTSYNDVIKSKLFINQLLPSCFWVMDLEWMTVEVEVEMGSSQPNLDLSSTLFGLDLVKIVTQLKL